RNLGVTAESSNAAKAGVSWLLDLQNRDGGWPTFCRGWGHLPFDRSSADISAHALRAFAAWKNGFHSASFVTERERGVYAKDGKRNGAWPEISWSRPAFRRRMDSALVRQSIRPRR